MKHSSTWFVLTLIASALLLSAEKITAQSPNPRSPESQVTHAQPSQNSAQTKEPSPRQIPTAELGIPESSAEKVKADQQTSNSGGTAEPPPHDTFWAEWVMAIATTVYSFFAILQWRALKRTVDETQGLVVTANRQAVAAEAQVANLEKTLVATEKAANAAKQSADAAAAGTKATERYVDMTAEMVEASRQSAKAAEAALHIERPFLLVTKITGEVSHADMPVKDPAIRRFRHNLYFTVALKNYGVSPADIVEYAADVCLLDTPKPPYFRETPPAYGQPSQLNDSIIGPHESVPDRIKVSDSLDDTEYQSTLDDKQRIAVYGRIRYRGASDKTYDTFFYWWCFVIDPNQVDMFRCNTKQWNDHT
jgi:hypothetical protein